MTAEIAMRLAKALVDRYRIERELGGGGMSRVFLAREVALDRAVVIKVLAPGLAEGLSTERFGREIQLAASLQQANIVPLLAAGSADGLPYYAMPYVQGESLRGRLTQTPRLTVPECVGILRNVARALSYAHARGVVHRDIKPDNVLLSHGAAVVTDFGIDKAVSASRTLGDAATLTQVGTSLGTPAYMAPEQVAGDPDVDHRADLYAWGCLAYELLTGAPPFVRDTPQRTLAAHLNETPLPICPQRPEVPRALERLVLRCLAKEPAGRPPNADEILRDLEGALTPDAPGAAPPAVIASRAPASRRTAVISVAAVAAIVLLAVALTRGRSQKSAASATATDRSIAVLPLTNLSGDKSDDYFGIGLAEEMTRAIAKTGVRVIGRASAGALLARGLDERAVAKELGVGSVLTGSVQRANGQLRINVSLLSASDGAVRWTEKYDRPLANVFAVQDEIARSVAAQLIGSLGGQAPVTVTRNETADPEAHALVLQGQVLFNRRTAQTLGQAVALFEQAIRRDPKYARAYASLAMAYGVTPAYVSENTEALLAKATAAADRAMAIDSTIAEAYTAAAWVRATRSENREADRLYRRALALDSTVATTWGWYGLLATHMGEFATAHQRTARARELEPASLIVRTWDAQVFLAERRFGAADSAASQIIGMDSTFSLAAQTRAEALLGLQRAGEAAALLERRVAAQPDSRPTEMQGMLAYAFARAGKTQQARLLVERMRAASSGRLPSIGSLAAALDQLGDHASAVAVLGEAIARHEPWFMIFNRAERYDQLRRDPRAAALLAKTETW